MKQSDRGCFFINSILFIFILFISTFLYFTYFYYKIETKSNWNLKNQIFGHRGCFKKGIPENSIESIYYSNNEKFDGIEIDIHVTKDDKIIIIHDNHLLRISKRKIITPKHISNFIYDLTYDEIFKYFEIEKGTIELLDHFLLKSNQINPKLKWIIEIKEYEKIDIILNYFSNYSYFSKTILSSYNPMILYKIKKLNSTITTILNIQKNLFHEWFNHHQSSMPNTIHKLNPLFLNFIKLFSSLTDYFFYFSLKTFIPSFIGIDMICMNERDLIEIEYFIKRGYQGCLFIKNIKNSLKDLTLISNE